MINYIFLPFSNMAGYTKQYNSISSCAGIGTCLFFNQVVKIEGQCKCKIR